MEAEGSEMAPVCNIQNEMQRRPSHESVLPSPSNTAHSQRTDDSKSLPSSFVVLAVHSRESNWKLIQYTPANGPRQRIQCLHLNDNGKKHQTKTVCTRCRRFVCLKHWRDGAYFSDGACIEFNSEKVDGISTSKKGGRPRMI